jgi:hypothetical protein
LSLSSVKQETNTTATIQPHHEVDSDGQQKVPDEDVQSPTQGTSRDTEKDVHRDRTLDAEEAPELRPEGEKTAS